MNESRPGALDRLEPLVGTWEVIVDHPSVDPDSLQGARTTFEWMDGGRLLIQRSEVPNPQFPNGLCVIAYEEDKDRFMQHYFDSRGVIRLYEMTMGDGVWTLLRESPDFSPLDFSQRFTGTFNESGDEITGAIEMARDGSTWELDFEMTYRRVG